MALGGWINNSVQLTSATRSAAATLAWVNAILNGLALSDGWSVTTAATTQGTYNAFGICTHTGGAELCVFAMVDTSGTLIHADNMFDNAAEIGSTAADPRFCFAYCPTGSTGFAASNPATSGFVPADSLGFVPLNLESDQLYLGGYAYVHFMVRAADIIIAFEDNSNLSRSIDYVYMCGDVFDTLANATDTNKQGILSFPVSDSVNGNTRMIAYWRVSGVKTWGYGTTAGDNDTDHTLAYHAELLSSVVCDRAPWSWEVPIAYLDSIDLGLYGVEVGNGVKGTLNPEMLRLSYSGMLRAQPLEGGNLIHLGNGIVVGYDAANTDLA